MAVVPADGQTILRAVRSMVTGALFNVAVLQLHLAAHHKGACCSIKIGVQHFGEALCALFCSTIWTVTPS